ncbi:MAG: AMP-binding protein [Paracoccaceae bacterium]|nr:AMP-binding protein [Paracoccaceae bacterium]
MTLDHWIVNAAARTPEKPALISDSGALTYREFASRIDRRSRELAGAGTVAGDRVAWYGLNNPEVFVLLFACARLGGIFVPLNWRLADAEIAAVVADCEPRILVHDGHFRDEARALSDVAVISADDPMPATRPCPPHAAGEDAPILIVYTSGSTGSPKGTVLTQKALACNAAMSIEAHDLRAGSRVLNVLPTFHVGGLNILPVPAFRIGATVLLHERFDSTAACRALGNVTHAITVPTVLQGIINDGGWNHVDLSGLRTISIGSTDVPLPLVQTVQSRGVPVTQIYGATETGPFAIYQRVDEAVATTGSIGRAGSQCAVRLVRDGLDVSDGKPGEIWVRGDNVMTKYWRNPGLTADALRGGWFRTGDIARRDGRGLYWFVDRIKHVIISGGENIYPAEIERILRDIPGVSEVAVVGVPDPKWGESPVAVVAAECGMTADAVLAPLAGRIARYKHPKSVVFVDALPRNAMGKVIVDRVRERIPDRPVTGDEPHGDGRRSATLSDFPEKR